MLVGLDVGGTHTDAVVIDNKRVIARYKIETNHNDLSHSITSALAGVVKLVDPAKIVKINLSTTLSTNAIVQDSLESVAMVVSPGPGIAAENFKIGDCFTIIGGAIDHRGEITQDIDSDELQNVIKKCKSKSIKVYAVLSKFAIRNPSHEKIMAEQIGPAADFVTMGHTLSATYNFPRRIVTAYFNSAVWRLNEQFIDAIEQTISQLGIHCDVNILKADGGTMPIDYARNHPIQAVHSGPSASVMGIIALCDIKEDAVIVDIGGTTTDISIFTKGSPLVEREGISIQGHPSLIRAIKTVSIAVGGDSKIGLNLNSGVVVGPQRIANAMAFGGSVPTLLDALIYLTNQEVGNRENAINGLKEFARSNGISVNDLAQGAVNNAVKQVSEAVSLLLTGINEKPVYTIHEMLVPDLVQPGEVYLMGGPAGIIGDFLGNYLDMPVFIPDDFAVANAIGAAVARTTLSLELLADSSKERLVIPKLDVEKAISRKYTLEQARNDAREYLVSYAGEHGFAVDEHDVIITESSSFNMIEGFWGAGKDIRVRCQVKPGVEFSLVP